MSLLNSVVSLSLSNDHTNVRNNFQIKAKNQLRVNGLSMSMYFLTYFTVLIFIMVLTSIGVLVLVSYTFIYFTSAPRYN